MTLELSGSYHWNKNYTSPPYIESLDVYDTPVGDESFVLKCILPKNANPDD